MNTGWPGSKYISLELATRGVAEPRFWAVCAYHVRALCKFVGSCSTMGDEDASRNFVRSVWIVRSAWAVGSRCRRLWHIKLGDAFHRPTAEVCALRWIHRVVCVGGDGFSPRGTAVFECRSVRRRRTQWVSDPPGGRKRVLREWWSIVCNLWPAITCTGACRAVLFDRHGLCFRVSSAARVSNGSREGRVSWRTWNRDQGAQRSSKYWCIDRRNDIFTGTMPHIRPPGRRVLSRRRLWWFCALLQRC